MKTLAVSVLLLFLSGCQKTSSAARSLDAPSFRSPTVAEIFDLRSDSDRAVVQRQTTNSHNLTGLWQTPLGCFWLVLLPSSRTEPGHFETYYSDICAYTGCTGIQTNCLA